MFVAMPNVHGQYGTDTKPTSPHEISSPFLNEFKHILNLMREYSKKCIKHMILEDMLFRYFNKAPCAPSTFASVSSIFSSILQIKYLYQPHQCLH